MKKVENALKVEMSDDEELELADDEELELAEESEDSEDDSEMT